MATTTLAAICLQCIEFLELSDEEYVDPRLALKQLESIFAGLSAAAPEDRSAVAAAARARLDWFMQPPDERGYTPRKLLTSEHRDLLESLASGEAFH